MIQIIVQRKKKNTSFIKRVLLLKKELNISWIDAIILTNRISRRYGLVINTAIISKQECMYGYMDNLHNKLYQLFDTSWKHNLENMAVQMPYDKFELYKMGAGYRIYIAIKQGYIDRMLEIYR